MSTNDYPVLCGGTFFTLLLEARKQRTSKRDNTDGKTDGLSQTEFFIELIKIIKPNFNTPVKLSTLKKNIGSYRKCDDNGGTYFATVFGSSDIDAFNRRINTNYKQELSRVVELTIQFIDEAKSEQLVKALYEVIEKDKNITIDAEFIFNKATTKSELLVESEVCLPTFVLAIWHYIVMNVKDNSVGKYTFTEWHTKKGEVNSEWIFRSDIGTSVNRKITVLPFADFSFQTTLNEHNDFVEEETESQEEPFTQEKTADNTSAVTNQVIINGNVYNRHVSNSKQYFGNIGILID